ncbi:unnamed protein product [Calypogeia fissa]
MEASSLMLRTGEHFRTIGAIRVRVARRESLFNRWQNVQNVSAKWESSDSVAAEVNVNGAKAGGVQERVKVLMAAGGTGGHVYPAIAIADEIRRLSGDAVEVKFVGTKDRMEWLAVPRAGFQIRPIPAVAIRRPFASFENLQVPAKLLRALFASWSLLRQVRPHVVVGTGGYVSGPVCLLAALMGYPVVIQEQNAYAGLTNRILGFVAKAVFVAFTAAIPYFPKDKCMLCGNPIRPELRQCISAAVARRFFFPEDQAREKSSPSKDSVKMGKQVLLILGGSLGAQCVNRAAAGMVATMLEESPTRYVIWQTGPSYYDDISAQVGSHPRLAIYPFVNAMHLAYAAADLVVARAGAITCSELLGTGKPSILIPSTNVAEDHQTKNAIAMAEQGAAKVLLESSLDSSVLATSVNELLGNPQMLITMTERAMKAATPDASTQIAKHVLLLAKYHVCVGAV